MNAQVSGIGSSDHTSLSSGAVGKFSLEKFESSSHVSVRKRSVMGVGVTA